jgi:hypothetical protein
MTEDQANAIVDCHTGLSRDHCDRLNIAASIGHSLIEAVEVLRGTS